jgi:hypothetical protein
MKVYHKMWKWFFYKQKECHQCGRKFDRARDRSIFQEFLSYLIPHQYLTPEENIEIYVCSMGCALSWFSSNHK